MATGKNQERSTGEPACRAGHVRDAHYSEKSI
jgi:hypothetical protein